MGQFNDTGYGTVRASGLIPKSTRVTRAGDIAGANDRDIGITISASVPGNEVVTVSFANKQGAQKAKCAGAIPIDAPVFTAADGRVSAAGPAGTFFRGIALQAGVDGEVIEIMPVVAQVAQA